MSEDFAALAARAADQHRQRPGHRLFVSWQGLSLADIRRDLLTRLDAAGIDAADQEVRFLIEHALAPARLAEALADPVLAPWQKLFDLADLATARLTRKPLSQVLGTQPFWTIDLTVTGDVLTPRADTETLVEAVLSRRPSVRSDPLGRSVELVDLGTGSGAIVLALLHERADWTGLGVDVSSQALAVARANAERVGVSERVRFLQTSWSHALADESADIVVSNPPYIVRDVLAGLEPEVRDFEPHLALDGGEDGLDAYRVILDDLPRILRPDGLFALEIGYDQAEAVSGLARVAGLVGVEVLTDLAGLPRVVLGFRNCSSR